MRFQRIAFVSRNAVLPDHDDPTPATILIDAITGKITDVFLGVVPRAEIKKHPQGGTLLELIDLGDKYLLPGLVDAHVHLNEPGRTDWEGFYTGTQAAASGGVCTVVDMPLNSIPPTTTVANLEVKRSAARGKCWTDVAFWGGLIPGNREHLKPLVEAGVKGFKCFMIDSGVEDFPCVSSEDVAEALSELAGQPTKLLFHAELDVDLTPHEGEEQENNDEADTHNCTLYSTFLASRSPTLEYAAIAAIIALLNAQRHQQEAPLVPCHIVHLSAATALPLLHDARMRGLPLTVETCFHYLCLPASAPNLSTESPDLPPDARPEFKCCPPIRDRANREQLWRALFPPTATAPTLAAPLIDTVVSDHSPCPSTLKHLDTGNLARAWGGVSSLGLGLSLLWTEALARARSHAARGGAGVNAISIHHIVDWTSRNTARHAGLGDVKGQLTVGYDADLVVFDPSAEFTVTTESLKFKNKISPYVGMTLRGRVEKTYLRGRLIYDSNMGCIGQPRGRLL